MTHPRCGAKRGGHSTHTRRRVLGSKQTPHEEAGWDMYRNTHKELRLLRACARKVGALVTDRTPEAKQILARLEEILDRHNDYK